MNPIATSALVLTLLLFTSFVALKISEVSVSSSDQIAQPTPPANKSIEEIKSSNPACSPIPTPVSENEKNNPLAEMTAEDELNASLGTFDWDCDGVCNIKDNCIFVYNPDQKDSNGDGKGDACDPKFVDPSFKDSRCDQDRGGIPDFRDNCPLACNPDQKDMNKNGIGDLCDKAYPNAVLTLQVCSKPRKVKVPKSQKISTVKNN